MNYCACMLSASGIFFPRINPWLLKITHHAILFTYKILSTFYIKMNTEIPEQTAIKGLALGNICFCIFMFDKI
jgi:hypothetical protein